MQCPKCTYEPTLKEQQESPEICPKCSVVYAKVHEQKQQALVDQQERIKLERQAIAEQRQRDYSSRSPKVRNAMTGFEGAQPVVVVDVNMRFGSMVVFMIKWVLASIPAAIILVMLVTIVFFFFGGVIQGLSRI